MRAVEHFFGQVVSRAYHKLFGVVVKLNHIARCAGNRRPGHRVGIGVVGKVGGHGGQPVPLCVNDYVLRVSLGGVENILTLFVRRPGFKSKAVL